MRLRLIELPVPPSPSEAEAIVLEAAGIAPLPDIFFMPELFSTGYVLDSLPELAHSEDGEPLPAISAFCSERGIWAVAGTIPVRTSRGIVNRLHVYSGDGAVVHSTEKAHLFRQMGEDRVFSPGIPSMAFGTPWMNAGAIICYDLRFPELSRRLTLSGAEIVFVPAQWPEPRMELFRCLLRARSAEAQVFFAGCNIGGEHLGIRFGGGGGVSSPSARLLPWIDVDMGVRDFSIDPEEVLQMRQKIDCLRDRRPEVY